MVDAFFVLAILLIVFVTNISFERLLQTLEALPCRSIPRLVRLPSFPIREL